MSARRDGTPLLVDPTGETRRLERLEFSNTAIQESRLQTLLHEHPGVLPVEQLDPGFSPLVSLGREVPTPAGPIDNLYISPNGMLTVVEAKLWRNPEARRKVVGQILDYAKELSAWGYEELDDVVRKLHGRSLWTHIGEHVDASELPEEHAFVDAVARNLQMGRFLLLVVGDGIREDMERIAEYLQGTPQLHFTLALVELQVYRTGIEQQLLIVPSVVARTVEVTRAVVRVESTGPVKLTIGLPEPIGSGRKTSVSEDNFFRALQTAAAGPQEVEVARRILDEFGAETRFTIDWKVSSFVIKLQDPIDSRLYTVLVVQQSGTAYIGWLHNQLIAAGLPAELGDRFAAETASLLGFGCKPNNPDTWERPIRLSVLHRHYAEFKTKALEFADQVYLLRSEPNSPA